MELVQTCPNLFFQKNCFQISKKIAVLSILFLFNCQILTFSSAGSVGLKSHFSLVFVYGWFLEKNFDQQTNYNYKCKLWAIPWHLSLNYVLAMSTSRIPLFSILFFLNKYLSFMFLKSFCKGFLMEPCTIINSLLTNFRKVHNIWKSTTFYMVIINYF